MLIANETLKSLLAQTDWSKEAETFEQLLKQDPENKFLEKCQQWFREQTVMNSDKAQLVRLEELNRITPFQGDAKEAFELVKAENQAMVRGINYELGSYEDRGLCEEALQVIDKKVNFKSALPEIKAAPETASAAPEKAPEAPALEKAEKAAEEKVTTAADETLATKEVAELEKTAGNWFKKNPIPAIAGATALALGTLLVLNKNKAKDDSTPSR